MTRTARIAALLLLVAAPSTRADDASFAVDRFQLDPGAYGLLGVASARVPEEFDLHLSLGLDWANALLQLDRGGSKLDLVGSSLGAQLSGAVALGGKHEIGLVIPLALSRSTESGGRLPAAAGAGIGDVRIVPKVVLPGAGAFRFAASLPFTLPTAPKGKLLGEGTFTVTPTGIAETTVGLVRVAGNLGFAVRPKRTFYDLEVGSAVTWGAAAELPFRAAGQGWAALASLWGEVGVADAANQARPMEGDAAVRWEGPNGLAVTAGLGTGIVNGYGAPALRVFALAGWRPYVARTSPPPPPPLPKEQPAPPPPPAVEAPPAPAPKEEPPPPPPPAKEEPPPPRLDPCAPGTVHTPEQCPDLDDDGDGIPNGQDRCPLVPGTAEHQGCPPPKAVLTDKKIEIAEAVFFDNGKDTIQSRSFQLLDDVARILAEHPEVKRLSVEGHTDSKGDAAKNQRLSERRAAAVKAYLVKKGIAGERLEIHGIGSSRPVASNDTDEGRAKNRRVEFIVKP